MKPETDQTNAEPIDPPRSEPDTKPGDVGETSDGYHTFNELYEHRHALFLALMAKQNKSAWASALHDDGSSMAGWFIAGIDLPTGTITYHLPDRLWGLAIQTGAKIIGRAPKWDGHTSDDVVKRLKVSVVPEAETCGWRDIKSAPRDGTHCLLWEGSECFIGWFSEADDEWNDSSAGMVHFTHPTHWQPLLPPPDGRRVEAKEGEG